ncbi:hypothetical protein [Microbacterium lushaniae]|nr:hypothetical protein [Microbacterium lushaniae]
MSHGWDAGEAIELPTAGTDLLLVEAVDDRAYASPQLPGLMCV